MSAHVCCEQIRIRGGRGCRLAAGSTTGEVSTTGVSRLGGVVGGTGGGGTAPPEREARVGLGLATGGISVGELALCRRGVGHVITSSKLPR